MLIALFLVLYVVAINVMTVLAYRIDKEQAQLHGWRVAEKTLLLMGFAGGTVGAYWAQKAFRHKTYKPSFQRAFWSIATFQVAAVTFCAVLLIG